MNACLSLWRCVSCSYQEAEWAVQELCDMLSLPEWSSAGFLAGQTEAHRLLQWTHSREAHLQPHRSNGELSIKSQEIQCAALWPTPLLCALVQVQSAALDEMFHRGTASVQCYHKALLLMEGVSRTITDQKDIDSIGKCRWRENKTQSSSLNLPHWELNKAPFTLQAAVSCMISYDRLHSPTWQLFKSDLRLCSLILVLWMESVCMKSLSSLVHHFCSRGSGDGAGCPVIRRFLLLLKNCPWCCIINFCMCGAGHFCRQAAIQSVNDGKSQHCEALWVREAL